MSNASEKEMQPADPELSPEVLKRIKVFYEEASDYINLPPDINFVAAFSDSNLLDPERGVGGYTWDSQTVIIAFDDDFIDKEAQDKSLKAIVFHELFHVAQGFSNEMPATTALHNAIYEGCASVFERDRGAAPERRHLYKNPPEEICQRWLQEIASLGIDYDWHKYKVYDEDEDRYGVIYVAGRFAVDKLLAQSPEIQVEDLAKYSADQIQQMLQKAGIIF